jgi:hypothetical protein
MIFHKNMLIEIGNNKITKTDLCFLKKKKKHVGDMLNRSLYIVIYEEEVYIKKFNLPKTKGEILYNLVKTELSFSVGDINNILFDYKITKHMNSCIEVMVFYINYQKIAFIKENSCYKNIEKIMLIQFAMKKYYRRSIKEENYILTFIYDNALYILAVNNNNLIANCIIENFTSEEEKLMIALETFRNKYSEQTLNIKVIYLSNIPIDLNSKAKNLMGMVVKILDKYKKEKLISSFL